MGYSARARRVVVANDGERFFSMRMCTFADWSQLLESRGGGRVFETGRMCQMAQAVILMIASRGCWILGSGTVSTRTSPLPCQQSARMVISPFLGTACTFRGHVVQRQQERGREVPGRTRRRDCSRSTPRRACSQRPDGGSAARSCRRAAHGHQHRRQQFGLRPGGSRSPPSASLMVPTRFQGTATLRRLVALEDESSTARFGGPSYCATRTDIRPACLRCAGDGRPCA